MQSRRDFIKSAAAVGVTLTMMEPVMSLASEKAKLKVVPLSLGQLQMPGAVLTRLKNYEERAYPCLGYVIMGGDKTILVDSGAPEPDSGVKTFRPVLRDEGELLVPQLEKLGLKPDDIDLIINTHLHWDHIYGNNKIPKADIIVQEAEMDYYNNPFACDRGSYEKNKETPFVSTFLPRIKTVKGDAEIIPGVRVLLTPGHTPGCQTVVVDTPEGKVILPGDNISLLESLENYPPHIPGIITSSTDFYGSMEKLKKEGDAKILPAHEREVLKGKSGKLS